MKKFLAIIFAVTAVFCVASCKKVSENINEGTKNPVTSSDEDNQEMGSCTESDCITSDSAFTSEKETDAETTEAETDEKPEEKTLYELYREACTRMQSLDSYEMNMDMTVKKAETGISIEVPVSINTKVSGLLSDAPVSSSVAEAKTLGVTVTKDVYTAGGYSYYTSKDGNYRTKTAADGGTSGNRNIFNPDLHEECFAEGPVIRNEDGSAGIEVVLSEKLFKEKFGPFIKTIEKNYDDYKIYDIKIFITISGESFFKDVSMSFKMSHGEGNSRKSIGVSSECRYIDPGKNVIVEAPEGYENYPNLP